LAFSAVGSDPATQDNTPPQMQGDRLAMHQALGVLDIVRCRGVLKCFQLKAIVFVPLAGADM
jgi:hypothetical protein